MKKYVFILSLVAVMLFVLTACGNTVSQPATTPEQEVNVATEPEHEYIRNSETVTVRFYYHSPELDPNIYSLPEAFLYNTEEISIENLEEEFIRLMHEHTGVRILDLRFAGDRLYVNLHEDAIGFFDHHGTTGGTRNTIIFENTIASFIPGMGSFEVLVNGQRGVEGNHFNFGHIAIVENGEVIRREYFDMPLSDNDTQIQLSTPNADNPFSAPLLEYFAGAADEPNYFIMEGNTRAFIADITGEGDIGVVAIRFAPPTGEGRYLHGIPQGDANAQVIQSRIFAEAYGEVFYFDIDHRAFEFGDMIINGRSPSITERGRFVIETVRDRGYLALTLVGLDTSVNMPMFTQMLTIYRDFHGVNEGYTFYSFNGSFEQGLEGGRTPITEQEFNDILDEIGFEEWAFAWSLWDDQTEQILAMTFD